MTTTSSASPNYRVATPEELAEDSRHHAEAFLDMEAEVNDLERAGRLAQHLILDDPADIELTTFAVCQLARLCREFKEQYYKNYHGPNAAEKEAAQ